MLITHHQIPLRRFLLGKRATIGTRGYRIEANKPPAKSYTCLLSPVSMTWNALIPPSVKYFGAACTLGLALTKIHPNVLFTVGPPLLLSVWFLSRQIASRRYRNELLVIMPVTAEGFSGKNDKIQLKTYDESDEELVLKGIESEYDFFKTQIAELVARRIRDHASIESNRNLLLVDKNGQFCLHLSENYIETFIVLKAEIKLEETSQLVDFIKLSMPLFASRQDKVKKATVEVYLLQVPGTDLEYKITLRITPYKLWTSKSEAIVITSLPGGPMKSEYITKSKPDITV